MLGKRSGKLTVVEKIGGSDWKCQCDCGNYKIVKTSDIKRQHVKSWGCSFNGNTKKNTHGSRLYSIWYNMKRRCNNINDKDYKNYGGRNIKICNEWLIDYSNFYNWAMQNGYQGDLTIDRINNDGNYEPSNCRWVTMKKQLNNQRRNKKYTYKNKTQTLSQWCEEYGFKYTTLRERLKNMPFEKAIIKPIDISKRNKLYKGGMNNDKFNK